MRAGSIVFDLSSFTLRDMTDCSAELRQIAKGSGCMEEAADRIVRFLYERLGSRKSGERSCALVRFFKTHRLGRLTPDLQSAAMQLAGHEELSDGVPCLVLLATAGEQPEWNSRHTSKHHRVFPLLSKQFVEQYPMIARLLQQLGLPLETETRPTMPLLLDAAQQSFNVFFVPDARGSPYVPAQEAFVAPYGIQSALGFGGVLSNAELFAVVLFTRTAVPRATVNMFRPLALSAKLAVLPFAGGPIFADSRCRESDHG